MVQKVSAIFSGGVTTGTYSGPSIGVAVPIGKGQASVAGGYTNLKGGSQSLLSSRLSPPSKPVVEEMGCMDYLVIGGGLAFLCPGVLCFIGGINGIRDSSGDLGFLILIFVGLGLVGSAIFIFSGSYYDARKRKAKADLLLPRWEESMTRWDRLYYCARDDGVFDPDERVFIPTAQMMDYISR